jgi:hypothetical protein
MQDKAWAFRVYRPIHQKDDRENGCLNGFVLYYWLYTQTKTQRLGEQIRISLSADI